MENRGHNAFTSAAAPPTGKFGKRLQNKILAARPDVCAKFEKKLRMGKPPKRGSSANKKKNNLYRYNRASPPRSVVGGSGPNKAQAIMLDMTASDSETK